MDYRIMLGVIATLIGFFSYVPYVRDVLRGKTKPHIYSWLIWAIVTGVAFFAQIAQGAFASSWVNGIAALTCTFVVILSIKRGEKNIVLLDVICLVLGLITIILWILTKNPFIALLLISLIDILAFIPTFRKVYHKPYEETLSTYVFSFFKYTLSTFALSQITLATSFFPIFAASLNGLFAAYTFTLRKIKIKR